jgi:site-specific recombinase XerD
MQLRSITTKWVLAAIRRTTRAIIATELNRIERESGAVSANRFRATLSSFFNWAAREGLIDANPAAFTNKRTETPRDRVLADDEIRAILAALPRPVTSATSSDFYCSLASVAAKLLN